MRSIIFIAVSCLSFNNFYGQATLGIDQYSYMGTGQNNSPVPVAHYQSSKNWYAEARYNYDEYQTFSLYAGKTFARQNAFSYAFTPMIGGMTGKLNGGSFGLNTEFNYKKFNFTSQSQYSIIPARQSSSFFFSWSEFYYQPLQWLYTGVTLQHTRIYNTDAKYEPGILLGFSFDHWSFPIYSFSPYASERYFVLGINWEWNYSKTQHRKPEPRELTKADQ